MFQLVAERDLPAGDGQGLVGTGIAALSVSATPPLRFKFGAVSTTRLLTCHPDLQKVARAAMGVQLMDFSVLQGHRSELEQIAAFTSGASKKQWPHSRHNSNPSLAIDLAPYPIRWGNLGEPDRFKSIGRFYKLAGIVLTVARELKIPLRWGGDWSMDGDVYDQDFDDLPHFELVNII